MAQFTRKAIMATFQDMLEEIPFDKITVSALVKRCEISSNTFYYHFRDIYDLLDQWLAVLFDRFLNRSDGSWPDSIKEFLRACQNNKSIVYHLSNSLSRERMEQYIFSRSNDFFVKYIREITGDEMSEEKVRQIAEFCRYSVTGFFLHFLWDQMNEDVNATVDNLEGMLYGFIVSVSEKEKRRAE